MQILNGAKFSPLTYSFSSQPVHKGNGETPVKRDSIMISEESRQRFGQFQPNRSSAMESLVEKRQQIQEMKSDLRERTLEQGEDLATIKDQLAAFDEQIFEIEEQMSALETQQREREQREKEEQHAAANPKENSEAAQMTSLLQSVQSLEQVSALRQVKVPLENAHRRLKTEMKNDGDRGIVVESKAEKIQELAERIRNIEGAMNDQIRKARETSAEMNTKETVVEEEPEVESLETVTNE